MSKTLTAFNDLFANHADSGEKVSARVTRTAGGIKSVAQLNAAPAQFTSAAFGAAAMRGTTFTQTNGSKGNTETRRGTFSGAVARSVVQAMFKDVGDDAETPPAIKDRAESVSPNGAK